MSLSTKVEFSVVSARSDRLGGACRGESTDRCDVKLFLSADVSELTLMRARKMNQHIIDVDVIVLQLLVFSYSTAAQVENESKNRD